MSDALATYFQDHLAGAAFALELLRSLETGAHELTLRELAARLTVEIAERRSDLEALARERHADRDLLKEAAGWFAEKASRLKLRGDTPQALRTFELLETLELGIRGQEALWRALEVLQPMHPELAGRDFAGLAAGARRQAEDVERHRLRLVPLVFSSADED